MQVCGRRGLQVSGRGPCKGPEAGQRSLGRWSNSGRSMWLVQSDRRGGWGQGKCGFYFEGTRELWGGL